MKKTYRKFLIGILCLSLFTSCKYDKFKDGVETLSTEEMQSTEVTKGPSETTVAETETESTEAEIEATEKQYKNLEENDGQYIASIYAPKNGEVNEYNMGSVYEASSEGDVLIVKGSFNYSEDVNNMISSDDEILENDEYTFKIDASTRYMAVSGLAKPEDMGLEGFLTYFKECEETGLGLVIIIENGVATEVLISS